MGKHNYKEPQKDNQPSGIKVASKYCQGVSQNSFSHFSWVKIFSEIKKINKDLLFFSPCCPLQNSKIILQLSMADNYQVQLEASCGPEIFSFLFFFVILDFLCPYAATWSQEMMMGYDSRRMTHANRLRPSPAYQSSENCSHSK